MNKTTILNNKKPKYLLLWCSPGFGVIDIWLPVIRSLKKKGNVTIDFVFPEPSSLNLEEKNSDLFNLAEKFSDNVIYRGYSERWFVSSTLIEARDGIKFSSFDAKMANFSVRLLYGKASKYFILRLIGKFIFLISRYFIYLKENFGSQTLYDIRLFDNVDGILCDIAKENKPVNKELVNNLKSTLKFSMLHGLSPNWVEKRLSCTNPVNKRDDVTVYPMSHLENKGYKKCFGLLSKNIVNAGIPRHDKDWIEFICNQSNSVEKEVFDSFVFIIGRPSSPYNTIERKKKMLKDVYDIVCNKHKLKLVVKLHPKEPLGGIDVDIYKSALGVENYGKNWIFSNNHIFKLGRQSIFCISFFSGVVMDMLELNKPTIECLNLEGIDAYDNSNSLRDEFGKPVLQYRYTKLVLGASNRSEIEENVTSILDEYETTLLSLRSKYEKYFKPFEKSSETISNDIVSRIDVQKNI